MKKKIIKTSSTLFNMKTNARCHRCKKRTVVCREWESSDGAHTDHQYKCKSCGYMWWIDGPDY